MVRADAYCQWKSVIINIDAQDRQDFSLYPPSGCILSMEECDN